ncbi:hypothetical protein [Chroococcidiopsis sp.]
MTSDQLAVSCSHAPRTTLLPTTNYQLPNEPFTSRTASPHLSLFA